MEDKKSSSKMGKLPSGKGSNSENSEKLSPAGDLAEKKSVKKLDYVKDSPENRAALAEAEGKNLGTDSTDSHGSKWKKAEKKDTSVETKFDKKKAKDKKGEVVELEREYVVPWKRGVLKAPQYRRAKKAVKVLKEFMVRHMNVRDGDLRKVKIDMHLNNELWFRGIKKPANKIKVKAKKIDGIVYVELVEIPEVVGFKIAREAKAAEAASAVKAKAPKKVKDDKDDDKDKDGVSDKKEEAEDKKSGAEKAAKVNKAVSKDMKHTAQGKHAQKTMPVRKVLK
ncbi:MAG: 50S ribosomal protein L31e [archaeon]|nr:50S ribosomal protein L31e [archaeon]